MLRRWIIRSLAIALLTLCVTAWVGSYFEGVEVRYSSAPHHYSLMLGAGELFTWDQFNGWSAPPGFGPPQWFEGHGQFDARMRAGVQRLYKAIPYHLLGFAWQPYRAPPDADQRMMIPLWFPTTLSAAFLCLAWRKTRPKHTAKGFPVEVEKLSRGSDGGNVAHDAARRASRG
jgi:hypothetical protein